MKTPKKLKKPKSTKVLLAKAKRKAYRIWSEAVRLIHNNTCELCGAVSGKTKENGKPVILNAHHIVTRDNPVLRFDIRNGCCLCQYCHKYSRTGAHRGTIVFSEWLRVGRYDDYAYLLKRSGEAPGENLEGVLNAIAELESVISSFSRKKENLKSQTEISKTIDCKQEL
jgi:hypothetical protein